MPDVDMKESDPSFQLRKFENALKDSTRIQAAIDTVPNLLQSSLTFTEEEYQKIYDFHAMLFEVRKRNVDKFLETQSFLFTHFEDAAKLKENA